MYIVNYRPYTNCYLFVWWSGLYPTCASPTDGGIWRLPQWSAPTIRSTCQFPIQGHRCFPLEGGVCGQWHRGKRGRFTARDTHRKSFIHLQCLIKSYPIQSVYLPALPNTCVSCDISGSVHSPFDYFSSRLFQFAALRFCVVPIQKRLLRRYTAESLSPAAIDK